MEQYRQFALRNRLSVEQAAYFLEQISALSHVGGWEYDVKSHQTTWLDETYRIHDLPVGTPIDEALSLQLFDPSEHIRIKHKLELAIKMPSVFMLCSKNLRPKDERCGLLPRAFPCLTTDMY